MKKYESLKKVELHCHLDGPLNLDKVSKWTRKNVGDVEKQLRLQKNGDMEAYKECLSYPKTLLQTKMRLKDAAEQLCKDLQNDYVVYAEIRVDPLAHTAKDLTLNEIVDSLLEGIKNTTLKAKLILCMKRDREFEENKAIIDIAKKYLKKGVAAVDLTGDEVKYPTRSFKELFAYAKDSGVPFVVHAGETGTASDIDSAISFGASRIGHGVKAITSYDTMEALKRENIPLEICLSSNIATGLYEKYGDNPVQRLVDSGVSVVICTDNRTLANTTLTDEYNTLNRVFGFTINEFTNMNKLAIEHAFLSDKEKAELLKELE